MLFIPCVYCRVSFRITPKNEKKTMILAHGGWKVQSVHISFISYKEPLKKNYHACLLVSVPWICSLKIFNSVSKTYNYNYLLINCREMQGVSFHLSNISHPPPRSSGKWPKPKGENFIVLKGAFFKGLLSCRRENCLHKKVQVLQEFLTLKWFMVASAGRTPQN